MKILYVTNMYPDPSINLPYYGIFVQEQIDEIVKNKEVESELFYIRGFKSKLEYLKSIFQINYKIYRMKPDIVHVHYGLSALFLLLNPFIGKRTIVTLHGSDISTDANKYIQQFLTKTLIKKARVIIVMNEQIKRLVQEYNENVYVIKCGIDTTLFNCKNETFLPGAFQLLFPSDPARAVKNFELFHEAYLKVKDTLKSVQPVQFQVIKNLNRKQVKELLCKSDCLVLTSISEGSPQVIKEAMACNLPIVSVNVGDVKELLSDVSNCYVTSHNKEEIVKNVLEVFKNNNRSNGRQKIINLQLDNIQIASKIVEVYKRCLTD